MTTQPAGSMTRSSTVSGVCSEKLATAEDSTSALHVALGA